MVNYMAPYTYQTRKAKPNLTRYSIFLGFLPAAILIFTLFLPQMSFCPVLFFPLFHQIKLKRPPRCPFSHSHLSTSWEFSPFPSTFVKCKWKLQHKDFMLFVLCEGRKREVSWSSMGPDHPWPFSRPVMVRERFYQVVSTRKSGGLMKESDTAKGRLTKVWVLDRCR